MSDAIAVLFDHIFSDSCLRGWLEQACQLGRIRAKGRRIRYIPHEREPGQFGVSEFVEPKLEDIPASDWADLSLLRMQNEIRLEGSEKWVNGDQHYRPKAWTSVWFNETDLLALLKESSVRVGRPPVQNQLLRQFIATNYPTGKPADVTYEAILAEIKQKIGVATSVRSLSRAFGGK